MIPHTEKEAFLNTIRSFRDGTTNATAWTLSTGRPQFSSLYFDKKHGWDVDLLHFRLMLRKGSDPITLADMASPSSIDTFHFTYADLHVMDALIESLDVTATDIAKDKKISTTTAYRKRFQLLDSKTIQPRAEIKIPRLSDRVICLLSPECAGDLITAWSNLPLSYQSRIQNLEDKTEKKILLSTALPTGSGQDLIDVVTDEISRVHDYSVHKISASLVVNTRVSSMFDRRKNRWKWDDARYFDAISYSVARKEAKSQGIPIDLA